MVFTQYFAFMNEWKRISNKGYIWHIISLGYREIFWMNNPRGILPKIMIRLGCIIKIHGIQ